MAASFIAHMMVGSRADDAISVDDVERLVRKHARFVFRVAYSVLRNHHDAEDAAQETFLRVIRQGHRVREIDDARAWIGTIAFRVAVGRRRDPRVVELDVAADHLGALAGEGGTVEHEVQRAQLSDLMWRTVETLPAELRDALKLSTVNELTSAQAAVVLGVPEGTVRSRVHRAKQMLREKLAARMGTRSG